MPQITRVDTYDQALEAMNGRTYTLDGIHGTIKVEKWNGMTTISHNPSKRGMATDAYRETKRKLGDDWSSDLTYGDRFGEIAYGLGIRFKDEK